MLLVIRNINIIWFRGGGLNCFQDIKPFKKLMGEIDWAHHAEGGGGGNSPSVLLNVSYHRE